MKIKSHRESHIVELEDGSQWRIRPRSRYPGRSALA
jgi:hypothetical protein